MDSLVRTIGLAPSELPFGELLARVRTERERVRAALEAYRSPPTKAKTRHKAKNSATEMIQLARSLGLTLDEVRAALKEAQEGKAG